MYAVVPVITLDPSQRLTSITRHGNVAAASADRPHRLCCPPTVPHVQVNNSATDAKVLFKLMVKVDRQLRARLDKGTLVPVTSFWGKWGLARNLRG